MYLGGQSQSGFDMNTYITAFTDRLERVGPDGKPLFDGYMNLVGPGATPRGWRTACFRDGAEVTLQGHRRAADRDHVGSREPLLRCALGRHARSVSGHTPLQRRRADANSATDKFRFYEVAGAPHSDLTSPIIPINSEIAKAKADGTGRAPKAYFTGHEEGVLHLDEFVSGAIENLHAWAANGVPAPAADANWMWYSTSTDAKGNLRYSPLRDQFGNALGGLRSPYLEAPLYQYLGQGKTATGGSAFDWGSMTRFTDETINANPTPGAVATT